MRPAESIIVKGAQENNLQSVSLEIPKHAITVFTGVSGSGKSSLVFETIGAEAQRLINETYDSFVRSRMPQYGKPEVDSISNLNVAIIINQRRIGGNARSTVGTITDIYALLRLLFARIGEPFVGYSMVFSFNNPNGMCPTCEGLGTVTEIDIDRLIDRKKSLNEGAINFPAFQPGGWRWTRYVYSGYFDNDRKVEDYSEAELDLLLHAEKHRPKNPAKEWGKTVLYEGIVPRIKSSFLKKDSKEYKRKENELREILRRHTCPTCGGARLNPRILSCRIQGKNIAECCSMQVDALAAFLRTVKHEPVKPVLSELDQKLMQLVDIGLNYLSLGRDTASLSGGESQRIKMVKHLGSSLTDLLYIFDEPSIGLHPSDIDRINRLMRQLRDKGNTVLIVEHDPDVVGIADHIVDMGPGPGKNGGHVVYQGDLAGLKAAQSLTAQFWKKKRSINSSPRRAQSFVQITHANLNNLKDVSVQIPERVITVVTGVAGSGKSSLINHVLPAQHPHARLIDQGLLQGSRRSHLASYTGIFDSIRRSFAAESRTSASLFSANSEGACPQCNGLGVITLDLAFMDEVEHPCDLCHGTGYRPDTLQYTWKGKNIVEVLRMTVEEARTFLEEKPTMDLLGRISDMGLAYMSLGQPLSTFSGGERQRLKLAVEFDQHGQLYVFDEPTTGLHPSDIEKLMEIFQKMADDGNTVIIIEHNLEVISRADWIIDIGPGGGNEGGNVIFEGHVTDLLNAASRSKTGEYLKTYVEGSRA